MHSVLMVVIAFATGYWLAIYNTNVHEQNIAELSAQAPTVETQAAPEVSVAMSGDVTLELDRQGHAHAEAEIDGRRVSVLVDTGATTVAIRESDARAAGYRLQPSDFTVPVRTANGVKYAAPITLREIALGPIRVRNVPALVSRDDALELNLLGMSFLNELESVRLQGRQMILEN